MSTKIIHNSDKIIESIMRTVLIRSQEINVYKGKIAVVDEILLGKVCTTISKHANKTTIIIFNDLTLRIDGFEFKAQIFTVARVSCGLTFISFKFRLVWPLKWPNRDNRAGYPGFNRNVHHYRKNHIKL
ncbi:hypothetical protein LXL04_033702 [Taraxacum kok-saghyz]